MSEYQYYEFIAVDRPLSVNGREQLRRISSRAHITDARAMYTYSDGGFRADERMCWPDTSM